MTTERLAELAVEAAFDGAAVPATMLAELMILLVRKGIITSDEAREIVLRTQGVIRFYPAHSAGRTIFGLLAERLAQGLSWPPDAAALSVDPLPPEPGP